MLKLTADEMTKLAYCEGKARTMGALGLPSETIKEAFVSDGIRPELAEEMTKEAFWGLIARGIIGAGRAIGPRAASLVARGAARGGTLGKGMQGIGQLGRKAGTGLRRAGGALARSPGQALWGGAKEFGKGAIFMGGKGVGGTLGKGAFGTMMGSTLLGPGQASMPQVAGGGMMSGGYGGAGMGAMGYGGGGMLRSPWTNPYPAGF